MGERKSPETLELHVRNCLMDAAVEPDGLSEKHRHAIQLGQDIREHIFIMEDIPGIHENQIFTMGMGNSLVHGIVDSGIGFRYPEIDLLVMLLQKIRCIIGRRPVDNDKFIIAAGLGNHAFEGGFQSRKIIAGYCYDGKFHFNGISF